MRRIAIVVLALLVPAALTAAPTIGLYFSYSPEQMTYNPTYQFEMFDGYVYAHNTECYLSAAEFMVDLPTGIDVTGFDIPEGSINLGDPATGMSITYSPPMDGWNPGYNLLCTVHLLAVDWCCENGGCLVNAPIALVPHPDSGLLGGTCWPDQIIFEYVGLTSVLCPCGNAAGESSWGEIKSMLQ